MSSDLAIFLPQGSYKLEFICEMTGFFKNGIYSFGGKAAGKTSVQRFPGWASALRAPANNSILNREG